MKRSAMAGRAGAMILVAAGLLSGACASTTSPTSPSSPPAQAGSGAGDVPASSVRLTVRVLIRAKDAPVSGAVVTVDGSTANVDAAGTCEFNVRSGATANVDVSASGFAPLGASGILMNDERWTFYLEPI